MTILQSIIFGIVEGVTEFLPISSTGHMILTAKLLGLTQTNFMKSFEIAIQLGAILSVVVLYWRSLFVNRAIMKRIAVAFIPTGILGLLLHGLVKEYLLGSNMTVVLALLIGGILLIAFEWTHNEKEDALEDVAHLSYWRAALIGVAQSVAMIPGVSRSAATIVGGMLAGLKRKTIVEFSFLLAVPTMLAATILDLSKSYKDFSADQFDVLAVGFIVSFFVALASIKFLLRFVKTNTFVSFGVYRIAVAVLFLLFVL
ncbi:MAG: Undecaprenyl-diphosphatase [Candidatus Wolfebacteria bacterium GW2011_GWC2_39_22]|uniref:Undecaprenyl-diphosphatase n=1 Tax=Candidatus Wolfebacteria bacterium GW2011_GWC2_39_22 TaxID=1619013 RepID=A0A0G0NHK3_9BACT|nr:MAG: Undecaprenyl-diphosphatase [Candidatus Wolfebacteria bacterium GW2011_GWC2_39_22]HBI25927.1 undecaprenyl-diphosphatase [Candidatus Wolfebacteria bacterium]